MRTSWGLNVQRTIAFGVLRRSFLMFFVGLLFAIPIQLVLKTSSLTFFFMMVLLPCYLSQLAYGAGKPFGDAALERFKIALRRLVLNTQNRKGDVSDIPEANFTAEKEERMTKFYGPGGVETYGFRLAPLPGTDPVEYYHGLYEDVLECVQEGIMVKDVVMGREYSTPYIREYRKLLLEKGICEQLRYLFITFDPIVDRSAKEQILNKLSGVRPVAEEEMAAYLEFVAAPERPASGRSKPEYRVSQMMNGKYIESDYSGNVHGAASLCTLPKNVERDFNLILAKILTKSTIVATTYKHKGGFLSSWKSFERMFFKSAKIEESDVEKDEARDRRNLEAKGDKVDLYMYQSILMFDTPKNIDRRCLDLQNVRQWMSLREVDTPFYYQDHGFIEESFRAALPSAWAYLPQRLHEIESKTEAVRYLPIESRMGNDKSPLVFRTIRNTPFYVDIRSIRDRVMTLIVGDTGTGKSSLIAIINKALLYLEDKAGIDVGFVNIDIGGTSSWVKHKAGVFAADLADVDENGQSKPWSVHPLHCLLDPEKRPYSSEVMGYAMDFLLKFMGFKTHVDIAKDALTDSLRDMFASCDEYRFSNLLECFRKQFSIYESAGKVSEEMKFEWMSAEAILKKFSKGGIYGAIYDPDVTSRRNLNGVSRLYFNLDISQSRVKDLSTFHLRLAYAIGYSTVYRYSSTSGQYRLFHFYSDEVKKQSEYIDAEDFLELKNQSRKIGFLVFLGLQSPKHLLLDNVDKEKRKEIFEGIRDVWVGNVDFHEDRSKFATILGLTDDDERLDEDVLRGMSSKGKMRQLKDVIDFNQSIRKKRSEVAKIEDKTDAQKEFARLYTIGYISEEREIENVFLDMEIETEWEITTHAAGREIREMAMKQTGRNPESISKILAKLLPEVPTSKYTRKELEKLMEKIEGREVV